MKFNPSLLPSLAGFAQIAIHGSFTKAAIEMDMTRAALSQQLKGLEQSLGVRLLHRTTREMSLTEEGRRLLETLSPALRSIEGAVQEVGHTQSKPSGLIRVNTSRVAARLLLAPHLSEFLNRYPDIKLEIMLNDGLANIISDSADVGIRLGHSLDENMIAVPISPPIETAIVGSPVYFQKFGKPTSPSELNEHNCLAYRFTSSGSLDRWVFSEPTEAIQSTVVEPSGNAIFNDDELMLKAALQGIGLIKHLNICVQPHLVSGKLVRVLSKWCKPSAGFYLYAPTRAQMPARVRVLIDFLAEKRETVGKLPGMAITEKASKA